MAHRLLADSQVEATYTSLSKSIDAWAQRAESKARERALALAALRGGERALEIGVGSGLWFAEIVKQVGASGYALGLDRTPAMLERCRARLGSLEGQNYKLVQGDARRLPVEDESIDVAFCGYLLDLLSEDDIVHVLRELRRVLRPSGRLVLANMTHAERPWHSGFSLLGRISPALFGGCRPIQAAAFLDRAGLAARAREYIVQSGFPSEVTLAERA